MDNFYQSRAYKVYKIKKVFNSPFVRFINFLIDFILFFAIIYSLAYTFGYVTNGSGKSSYLIVALCLMWLAIDIFISFGYKAKNQTDLANAPANEIISYFSREMIELMDQAFALCDKYKVKPFNLNSIVFSLAHTNIGRYFLVRTRMLIDGNLESRSMLKIAAQQVDAGQSEMRFNKFLEDCKSLAVAQNKKEITFKEVILALNNNNVFFSHLLSELTIEQKDLEIILNWTENTFNAMQKKYYWQKDNFTGGIGKDWAYGYTPLLNIYSSDVTAEVVDQTTIYESKSRQNIIEEMEEVLAKSGENNILLIGDPGVGKETIVKSFAQKIVYDTNFQELNNKRVVRLDVTKILSSFHNESEIQGRFTNILNEIIHAGNIILYIDNIASLISANLGQIGAIDATQFLIPYFESGRMQIIANISYDDFKNKLQANTNLESMFTKIEVKELSKDEVLPSIEHLVNYVEFRHRVIFTYQGLKHLIELADRYIHDKPFPQKVVDYITELGVQGEKHQLKIIDVEEVDKIISERIKIPTGEIKEKEKDKLLNLEKTLHERVIGQEEAISAIANALRRARAGLSGNKRPIGSFLFIGPTGVGKTETARALAQIYYGSEKNIIRFDMSEFQEISATGQLIGTKAGRETIPGRLTQGVQNNPYSLVLFDELEKAHPNILNLLLQILDEGRLTDATGRTIDFTNTIIIATSNAGSEKIREYLKDNLSEDKMGKIIVDDLLANGIFKPEFINRFDKVVCFKPLTLQQIVQIVNMMMKKVNATLAEKNINLVVSNDAIEKLAREGYDPVFGARPLRRLIQEKIENKIAKELISEEVTRGQTIQITAEDL